MINLISPLILAFALPFIQTACQSAPEANLEKTPLEVGDVVYTRIDNPLYREVAKTTRSWVSHVGVIVDATPGEEIVAESSVPFSKLTPLKKFIAHSAKGVYAIKRSEIPLTDEQKISLSAEARRHLGELYHLGFNYDSRRQFCSKFVYDVYKNSCGIELGHIQTLDELLHENPKTPKWFWRTWYLGFIPWSRRTITPANQYRSPHWVTVSESRLLES